MQRIRLVYSKCDELRFTGNLDMQKVWERTFRRAGLPLAYSQGFHPQPKIHQACPLPLGFTSCNDLLDFWLDSEDQLEEIRKKLEPVLQPGLVIQEYRLIPQEEKPLQTQVRSASYHAEIDPDSQLTPVTITSRIDSLLGQNQCIRERRGKQYDLLSLIENLQLNTENGMTLEMTLAALPGATGRPEEVLDALGILLENTSITRVGLILK